MKIVKVTIAIFVVVVLVACIIVPISNPSEDYDTWYYDDYRSLESVSSASGSLELVDIGGTSYVHASNVGNGQITYSDGSTDIVNVQKAKLDVFFLYGQSNAAGRNSDPSKVDHYPELGTTYYFGYSDAFGPDASLNNSGFDVSLCDMYSLYDSSGAPRVAGLLPDFSYEYQKITGHKVYVINGAVGNKSILAFGPPNGFMWEYGDSILTAGLAEIDTDLYDYSCKYYMWIQGEGDSGRDIAVYKDKFLVMHNSMLDGQMAGVHFEKCFISKVRAENGQNSSIAQIELADENPNTIVMATTVSDSFTVSNGLMGADNLHYSQSGYDLIGTAFAESIGEVVNPTSAVMEKYSDLIGAIPIMIFAALLLLVAVVVVKKQSY